MDVACIFTSDFAINLFCVSNDRIRIEMYDCEKNSYNAGKWQNDGLLHLTPYSKFLNWFFFLGNLLEKMDFRVPCSRVVPIRRFSLLLRKIILSGRHTGSDHVRKWKVA